MIYGLVKTEENQNKATRRAHEIPKNYFQGSKSILKMSSTEFPKRPKPGEDEDDLLREMEKFDASKSSVSSSNIVSFQAKKKSKFAEQRSKAKEKSEAKREEESTSKVLSTVVKERGFNYEEFISKTQSVQPTTHHFPTVMKLDKSVALNNATKKPGSSLFAQQIASSGKFSKTESNIRFNEGSVISHQNRDWGESSNYLSHLNSNLLSDEAKSDIHEANVAILNTKTDEELQQDKNELLNTLSPEIIQFLMKRKASKRSSEAMEDEGNFKIQPSSSAPKKSLIHSTNLTNYALNTVKEEPEKMEWMEDVKVDPSEYPLVFSARYVQGVSRQIFIL